MTDKTFYITTAIDYANSTPHLGTAFEKIGADVIARFKRLQGYDVYFLMGNDEHSQNVRKKADELKLDPKTYCDQMAGKFKETWGSLLISNNDFIQTSEKRHHEMVKEIAQRIYDRGYIYKAKYQGLYCVSCEAFYQEKDLPEGICPNHKTKPELVEEENYFFKLSGFTERLKTWFAEHPGFLKPDTRKNEILSLLESGLEDISISRPQKGWGIRLPFDESAVAYVWFDALINYISALGNIDGDLYRKYWPANLHVIGKDITRFHAVVWPAMLIAAEITPPLNIWGHGFVYQKGEKMSKSRGNIADPLSLAQTHTPDVLRYHLMREIPWDKDGDFSEERLLMRYNSDLANDLGNLLSRTTSMAAKYLNGSLTKPSPSVLGDWTNRASKLFESYLVNMDLYQIHEALEDLWKVLAMGNQLIDEKQPWALAKDSNQKDLLNEVLYVILESLRVIGVFLTPIMPIKSQEILMRTGETTPDHELRLEHMTKAFERDHFQVNSGNPLFPRHEANDAKK